MYSLPTLSNSLNDLLSAAASGFVLIPLVVLVCFFIGAYLTICGHEDIFPVSVARYLPLWVLGVSLLIAYSPACHSSYNWLGYFMGGMFFLSLLEAAPGVASNEAAGSDQTTLLSRISCEMFGWGWEVLLPTSLWARRAQYLYKYFCDFLK